MEIILRPELIGFLPEDKSGTTQRVAAKAFKSACYTAAHAVGGRVSDFREPDITPSFYVVHIAEGETSTAVLGHRVKPFIAFAQPVDAIAMCADFVDHIHLASAFRDLTPFTPLDLATLNRPLTDDELAGLHPAATKVLRHWKADTLGKAMFNWFD